MVTAWVATRSTVGSITEISGTSCACIRGWSKEFAGSECWNSKPKAGVDLQLGIELLEHPLGVENGRCSGHRFAGGQRLRICARPASINPLLSSMIRATVPAMSDQPVSSSPLALSWDKALIALPIAHLIFASTYLFAFCVGFGAHVSMFVTVSDIFTTSISDVAPIYATIVIGALIFFRDVVRAAAGRPKREMYGPPHLKPFFSGWRKWAFVVIYILSLMSAGVSYLIGVQIDVIMTAVVLAMPLFLTSRNLHSPADTQREALGFCLLMLSAAFVWGAESGQKVRHSPRIYAASSNARCGDFTLVRKFGDLYLTSKSNGTHALIDGDCAQVFEVPAVESRMRVDQLPPLVRPLFEPVRSPSPSVVRETTTATAPRRAPDGSHPPP